MFGDFRLQRLRNRLPLGQHPLIEFEGLGEDELDPVLMRSGIGLPFLERLLPIAVLLPQQPRLVGIVGFQPGIERFHQHRQAQERA